MKQLLIKVALIVLGALIFACICSSCHGECSSWPSILDLPKDYAASPEIRRVTQRVYLKDAKGDPHEATRLLYENLLHHYFLNWPDSLEELETMLQTMKKESGR